MVVTVIQHARHLLAADTRGSYGRKPFSAAKTRKSRGRPANLHMDKFHTTDAIDTTSGTFHDIFKDNDVSSADEESCADNCFLSSCVSTPEPCEPFAGSSSIVLNFSSESSLGEYGDPGEITEQITVSTTNRFHVTEPGSAETIMMKNQSSRAQNEDRRVSGNLNATIAKLHHLQLEREVAEREANFTDEDSPTQNVYTQQGSDGFRRHRRRLLRSHNLDSLSPSLSPAPPRKASPAKSPDNSTEPPVIGVICPSPTAGKHQAFSYQRLCHTSSFASLSPGTITPGSSFSQSSSNTDLRSELSLTPSSRSESDEGHSPLPPLKGTPKFGRRTLPPLRPKSLPPVFLSHPPAQTKLGSQALVPPIDLKRSSELDSCKDDRRASKEIRDKVICQKNSHRPIVYSKSDTGIDDPGKETNAPHVSQVVQKKVRRHSEKTGNDRKSRFENSGDYINANPDKSGDNIYANPGKGGDYIYANHGKSVDYTYANPDNNGDYIYDNPGKSVDYIYANPGKGGDYIYANPDKNGDYTYATPGIRGDYIYDNPDYRADYKYASPNRADYDYVYVNPDDRGDYTYDNPDSSGDYIYANLDKSADFIHARSDNCHSCTDANPDGSRDYTYANPENRRDYNHGSSEKYREYRNSKSERNVEQRMSYPAIDGESRKSFDHMCCDSVQRECCHIDSRPDNELCRRNSKFGDVFHDQNSQIRNDDGMTESLYQFDSNPHSRDLLSQLSSQQRININSKPDHRERYRQLSSSYRDGSSASRQAMHSDSHFQMQCDFRNPDCHDHSCQFHRDADQPYSPRQQRINTHPQLCKDSRPIDSRSRRDVQDPNFKLNRDEGDPHAQVCLWPGDARDPYHPFDRSHQDQQATTRCMYRHTVHQAQHIHVDNSPTFARDGRRGKLSSPSAFFMPTDNMTKSSTNQGNVSMDKSAKGLTPRRGRSSSLCRTQRFSLQSVDPLIETKRESQFEGRRKWLQTRARSFTTKIIKSFPSRKKINPAVSPDVQTTSCPRLPDNLNPAMERRQRKSAISGLESFFPHQRMSVTTTVQLPNADQKASMGLAVKYKKSSR